MTTAADAGNDFRPDLGLSHVALTVLDIDRSAAFYARFAGFEVIHRRGTHGKRVVWLSDMRRPFAVVLVESGETRGRLEGIAHLGIGCSSREEVDDLCALARREGCLERAPKDGGHPVGYWALLRDPDGHNLELSHGQEVARQIERHAPRPGTESAYTSGAVRR